MRLAILAVGRARAAPEALLAAGYLKRAGAIAPGLGFPKIALHEVETSKARSAELRRAEEASRLTAKLAKGTALVALDARGENLASAALAAQLASLRDAGTRDLGFVIGGPDGLAPELVKKARWCLAFGAQTWPHLLVRPMLAEQLYRALSILASHPYHRA